MANYDIYKKDVLEASCWLYEHGYFGSHRGTGGNVSVRIDAATMAITPSSVRYSALSVDDIFITGFDLSVIEGRGELKQSVESGLHSIIYEQRPDINAVIHTHQIYGSVFALIDTPIPALFDEVSFSLGHTVDIIPYALSGTPDLARNVAGKLANNANAYIIQNHGILALGSNLDKAILHAELLEKVARIYCLALSTGRPVRNLPASTVELVAAVRNHEVKKALEKDK